MKTSKVIYVLLILVQILSLVAFGLSLYTIFGVVLGTISGGSMDFELNVEETGGSGYMEIELTPTNTGLLETVVSFEIALYDDVGLPLDTDAQTVTLQPGGSEAVSLSIEIAASDVARLMGGMEASIEVTLRLRTLYDLVGVTNTIHIGMGEAA